MTEQVPANTFHDKGLSLIDLVASSTTWEATIVPIGHTFRAALGTATGLSAIIAIAGGWHLDRLRFDDRPGLFIAGWPWFQQLLDIIEQSAPYLAVGHLLLACGLVLTSGFTVAGRRMQTVLALIAALVLVGLLPVVAIIAIAAANAAAWAIGAVLLIVLIFFGIGVMFDAV